MEDVVTKDYLISQIEHRGGDDAPIFIRKGDDGKLIPVVDVEIDILFDRIILQY